MGSETPHQVQTDGNQAPEEKSGGEGHAQNLS